MDYVIADDHLLLLGIDESGPGDEGAAEAPLGFHGTLKITFPTGRGHLDDLDAQDALDVPDDDFDDAYDEPLPWPAPRRPEPAGAAAAVAAVLRTAISPAARSAVSPAARAAVSPVAAAARAGPAPRGRSNKGSLRQFSVDVCRKVEEKGRTTYTEVADDLVRELAQRRLSPDRVGAVLDEKNIRRRAYDVLNVLIALDIISKEKKNLTWCGHPTAHVDAKRADLARMQHRVADKRQRLAELLRSASPRSLARLSGYCDDASAAKRR